mmetsp:Transcript_18106/g.25779  ORF Transcript_18106/g.25779 Transcript_18106/m.25779 type:complete len:155 (+) Transcript_18106:180-644(+)
MRNVDSQWSPMLKLSPFSEYHAKARSSNLWEGVAISGSDFPIDVGIANSLEILPRICSGADATPNHHGDAVVNPWVGIPRSNSSSKQFVPSDSRKGSPLSPKKRRHVSFEIDKTENTQEEVHRETWTQANPIHVVEHSEMTPNTFYARVCHQGL